MVDYTKQVNKEIQFRDRSTNNPTSWSWNFGDATTSILKDPKKKYVNTGTYTIGMNSTNACGTCATVNKTVNIVESLPVSGGNILWVIGGVAVVGIAAYFITRKKSK